MEMAIGTYTGDGNDNRSITGVGFQPDLVIIKGDTTEGAVWSSSAMAAGDTAHFNRAIAHFTNGIQAFEADGFQIGTHAGVNTDTKTYHYAAFRDNGDGDFKVGTYTGDGNDNRSILGVGFQPTFMFTKRDGSTKGCWRVSACSGDASLQFGKRALTANYIQALEADGFQLGDDVVVNKNGSTYHYAAFKDVAAQFANGTYIGDGNDNRSILGVGFAPDYLWAKGDTDIGRAAHRFSSQTEDDSCWFVQTANPTNLIQDLEADGFQLGNHAEGVNIDTVTHYYAVWKTGVTTHYQTLAATASGSASLTTAASFYRTLAATASGSAVLATAASYYRTLAATVSGVAVLTTVASYYKTLAATAVGSAVLLTAATFYRTLAATAVGSGSILISAYVRSRKIFSKIIQSFGIVQK